MPKVLFCVWEVEPFLKVGGLGELARSLPRALQKRGVDIRVIMPQYEAVKFFKRHKELVGKVSFPYGKKNVRITVNTSYFPNKAIPVYFLEQKKYLATIGPETFAVYAGAVLAALEQDALGWQPDIIHCNDYHTGLIPLLVKTRRLAYKTLFTIHSVGHQGRIAKEHALKLGVPESAMSLVGWEIKGKRLNFMKEGLVNADIVNTVSPTYAQEIMYEPHGYDMEQVFRDRLKTNDYFAIVNGIDYELRNPVHAKGLAHHYDTSTAATGKQKNKAAFQRKAGFTVRLSIPLIGFIGRLDNSQKGIDRLHRILRRIGSKGLQFVVMGKGETAWEERFQMLAAFHPKSIVVYTKYEEELAAYIYAASDFLLVPSNYEPCGQVQMHAMRYGALPIVRATGGLSDTVQDGHNGFVYAGNSSFDLERSLKRAVKVFQANPRLMREMITHAMETDHSWNMSAAAYHALYEQLMGAEPKLTRHLLAKLER